MVSLIVFATLVLCYMDSRGNSRANTCDKALVCGEECTCVFFSSVGAAFIRYKPTILMFGESQ